MNGYLNTLLLKQKHLSNPQKSQLKNWQNISTMLMQRPLGNFSKNELVWRLMNIGIFSNVNDFTHESIIFHIIYFNINYLYNIRFYLFVFNFNLMFFLPKPDHQQKIIFEEPFGKPWFSIHSSIINYYFSIQKISCPHKLIANHFRACLLIVFPICIEVQSANDWLHHSNFWIQGWNLAS